MSRVIGYRSPRPSAGWQSPETVETWL